MEPWTDQRTPAEAAGLEPLASFKWLEVLKEASAGK